MLFFFKSGKTQEKDTRGKPVPGLGDSDCLEGLRLTAFN
jgi:hypothetical protein